MAVTLHPEVRTVLDQLELADPDAASDATSALEWVVGGDDLGVLTQFGLQQFLWYELPFKWILVPMVRVDVARALGRFLDLAGFPRYAAICHSEVTAHVLATWADDVSEGYRMFREAMAGSGVEPPELPELRWGSSMGRVEYDAFWSTAAALELGQATGDLPRSGRRAADVRAELARTHLTTPRPNLAGGSLLAAVHEERIDAWAALEKGGARAVLLAPVTELLAVSVQNDPCLTDSLAPLRTLLEAAAGDQGMDLTARGYLPRLLVVELAERFGWLLPGHERPRGEIDVPPVAALHELARDRRLVRRRGRVLQLSRRGRAMLDEPGELSLEVASWISGEGFAAGAAELFLASMLADPHRSDDERCVEVAVGLTEEGWTVRGSPPGSPIPVDLVRDQLHRIARDADLFGWVVRNHRLRRTDLSPEGRLGALVALRSAAVAPRQAS